MGRDDVDEDADDSDEEDAVDDDASDVVEDVDDDVDDVDEDVDDVDGERRGGEDDPSRFAVRCWFWLACRWAAVRALWLVSA